MSNRLKFLGRLLVAAIAVCQVESATFAADAPADPYGILLKPIPEKLVVLTFDDSCRSHATFVGPLLKKLGFGATFYVSDAFAFRTRKDWYMTWDQIKGLMDMGFEIGNHTLGHGQLSATGLDGCAMAVTGLEAGCRAAGVARPVTFCWPFYSVNNKFCSVLREKGYLFARGGGERPYRPTCDCPFDVPSFSFVEASLARKDSFAEAAKQATGGRIVVFTFHGVPDAEHPAVGVEPARFEGLMKYLKDNRYTVAAMRDLAAYIDTAKAAQLIAYPHALPWGGRTPAWGGITRNGNRLYLCVDHMPADRKLTVPGMTTRIVRAWLLADPEKRPLQILTCPTGIQTVVVGKSRATFSPPSQTGGLKPTLRSQYPTVIVAELQGGPAATILDFVFPGLPEAVISDHAIRVKVPLATDLEHLAPTYRTGSPLVTGSPPSGTVRDFSRPQTYTITAADGSSRIYTVTVIPTRGAVGVSNPSFEQFDVLSEFDDTMGRNPAGATWRFKQLKAGDEVGIAHLAGPITAPPAPDGSCHAAFIRGPGNGISQAVGFDAGRYAVSFDVVKRRGYSPRSTPLAVTVDGAAVLTLQPSQITETWKRYTSPAFTVASGRHVLAFTLLEGDGMDLIDNVAVRPCE